MQIGTIITLLGLLFDITGAWLVAWNVVKRFHFDSGQLGKWNRYLGNKAYGDEIGAEIEHAALEASEAIGQYMSYEERSRRPMALGLTLLTVGFILQGVGAWWSDPLCKELLGLSLY